MDDLRGRNDFCNKVSRSIVKHLNNELGKAVTLNKCLLQRTQHAIKKRESGFVIPKTMIALLDRQYGVNGDDKELYEMALDNALQAVTEESKAWSISILSWKREKSSCYSVYVDKSKAFSSVLKVVETFQSQMKGNISGSSKTLIFCHVNKEPQLSDLRSLLYCSLLGKVFGSDREIMVCLSQECEDESLLYKEISETLNLKFKLFQTEQRTDNLNSEAASHPTHFVDCVSTGNAAKYRRLSNLRCPENGTAFSSRVVCAYKNLSCHNCRQAASRKMQDSLECVHVCNSKNQMLAQQTELYHAWCQDESEISSKELSENDFVLGKQRDKYFTHAGVQSNDGLAILEFLEMRKRQIKESFEAKLQINLEGENWKTMFDTMRASTMRLEFLKNSTTSQMKLSLHEDSLPADSTFVLYNFSRLSMLMDSHALKVQEGLYPPLPPLEEIDFSRLVEDAEWELLIDHIWTFHDVISTPLILQDGSSLRINCHRVVDYLQQLCRSVSAFYSRHHILGENLPHLLSTMNARIHLVKAAVKAMSECFDLLGIKPLMQM